MVIAIQVHCALPASIVLTIPLTRRPVDKRETESGEEGHNSDPSTDDNDGTRDAIYRILIHI